MNETKICSKCKLPKDLKEFNKNKSKKDGLQDLCKLCKKNSDSKYYLNNTELFLKRNKEYTNKRWEIIKDIFENRNCEKCGENRFWLLDFHHKDPKKKDFNIASKKKVFKTERLLKEIKKCITFCANCHRNFHYLEKTENITLKQFLKYADVAEW